MSIASDAPVAPTPSAMRLALLRRKIRGRCVRSSVSSVAVYCGNGRKVSITTRLLRRGTKDGAENRAKRWRNWSRGYQGIRRTAAATQTGDVAAGISGTLQGTIVSDEGRI